MRRLFQYLYVAAIVTILYGSISIVGYAADGDSIVETVMETLGLDVQKNTATVSDASKAAEEEMHIAERAAIISSSSKFVTLPEPSRDGYVFIEWNTSQDGSGSAFTAGEQIEIRDMSLYAIWKENTATPSNADRATASETDRKATDSDADYEDDMIIPDLEIY